MYRRVSILYPEVAEDEFKFVSNKGTDKGTFANENSDGSWFRYHWEPLIIKSDKQTQLLSQTSVLMNMGPLIVI